MDFLPPLSEEVLSLNLSQQVNIKKLEILADNISHSELKDLALCFYRESMVKSNVIKNFISARTP
jgi:hypothetical protein